MIPGAEPSANGSSASRAPLTSVLTTGTPADIADKAIRLGTTVLVQKVGTAASEAAQRGDTGTLINADYLGSTQTTMIGNVIQKQFLVVKDYPAAAALSLGLMLTILAGVLLYARALGTEDLV